METGSDAAIYDFHDTLRTGSIKVIANKKELTLSPGKEILLTRNSSSEFADSKSRQCPWLSQYRSTDVGGGIRAYVCDFSIAHGLTNVPIMRSLLVSKIPLKEKQRTKCLKMPLFC